MTSEELDRVMIVFCDSFQQLKKAAAAAVRAIAKATAEAINYAAAQEKEMELYRELRAGADKQTAVAELLRALDEVAAMDFQAAIEELQRQVEDAPTLPPHKIPKPPKRLGPVNKANYAANRPPKRARSSCYIRRH